MNACPVWHVAGRWLRRGRCRRSRSSQVSGARGSAAMRLPPLRNALSVGSPRWRAAAALARPRDFPQAFHLGIIRSTDPNAEHWTAIQQPLATSSERATTVYGRHQRTQMHSGLQTRTATGV